MNRFTRTALTVPVVGLTTLLATAGPAAAADGSVFADLVPVPVNGVDAGGRAMVEIEGTTLSFTLAAHGLLADAPHAVHIHYGESARNVCPTAADNTAAALDGEVDPHQHVTASEGAPAYGDIVVSLTISGDTSPSSGLAVDRFSADGDFEYMRGDVQVSEEVAEDILSGESAVVVHGVDHDADGTYSPGDRGVSDLDPSLPGEATDPAICGVLGTTPHGGVAAGDGSASGEQGSALPYVLGGLGLAAAGGAAFAGRRSARATA